MIKEYVESLRKAGMKITPQRLIILRKLLEMKDEHPSLNKLYTEVKKELPTISFSTLYSVIKKLEELGLVKVFDLLGESRIEVNRKPHLNIIDLDKGRIREYYDKEIIDILSRKIGLNRDSIYLINIFVEKGE
jgi:Fur family peroxide stress response transcriptional regulator